MINSNNDINHYIIENQNLKEIFEVARQITSGLDTSFIIKNINLFVYSKFYPKFLAFVLKNDIDDLTPIYHNYNKKEYSKIKLDFESIEDLTTFFESQEFSQISFEQFKKIFKNKKIISELDRDKPEFLIPLKSHKATVGIYLQGAKGNNEPYSLDDIQFCIDILSFTSIAIENANLYREAIVDRMTKLFTHHQFQENLSKHINIGLRYGNKFSLIMLDIDHFKNFNDKYGHLIGDFIIKEISKILMASIRNVDFAARYGGEEFMILLPEIDANSAFLLAERLRKIIESHDFKNEDQASFNVTISLGVIEFDPDHVKYNENIIEPLDQALYKSKQNGRNRVTLGKYE
ncbi:MAG: GGDEF domain-containing protein [Spirochaetes bacterium]|nr:GGDEF domain-containing protein [Spirochaetota bacterium]